MQIYVDLGNDCERTGPICDSSTKMSLIRCQPSCIHHIYLCLCVSGGGTGKQQRWSLFFLVGGLKCCQVRLCGNLWVMPLGCERFMHVYSSLGFNNSQTAILGDAGLRPLAWCQKLIEEAESGT